jgi:hypothetical protein
LDLSAGSSFSTDLFSFDSGVEQEWFLNVRPVNGDCVLPRLSIDYLETGFDTDADAYFNVSDNSGQIIGNKCGGNNNGTDCSSFGHCLNNFTLSDVEQIHRNSVYTISIIVTDQVQVLCVSPGYSFYARIGISCDPTSITITTDTNNNYSIPNSTKTTSIYDSTTTISDSTMSTFVTVTSNNANTSISNVMIAIVSVSIFIVIVILCVGGFYLYQTKFGQQTDKHKLDIVNVNNDRDINLGVDEFVIEGEVEQQIQNDFTVEGGQ